MVDFLTSASKEFKIDTVMTPFPWSHSQKGRDFFPFSQVLKPRVLKIMLDK